MGLLIGRLTSYVMHKELRILEAGQYAKPNTSGTQHVTSSVTSSFHTHAENVQSSPPPPPPPPAPPRLRRPTPKCVYCKQGHSSNMCKTVTDPQQRYEIVKKADLCFNCLGHHKASQCRSKNRCKNCNRKHHTSLCKGEQEQPENPRVLATLTPTQSTPATSTPERYDTQTSLLKTAIATICSATTCAEANLLFDEGAQRSFISHALATKLGLCPTSKETINLSAFGASTSTKRNLDVATIHVETQSSGRIPVQVLIVPKIATPIHIKVRTHITDIPYLRHLKLAHPVTSDENFEISLLIGVDHYWDFVEDHIIRGNGPTAMQSKLGYLLSGPIKSPRSDTTPTNILNVMISHYDEDKQLEKFWSLESLGITSPTSNNDESNLPREYQQSAISREDDGSYTAKFPWKDDHPSLPSNFSVCQQRTRSTIRRLSRSPELLQTYGTIINDQLVKGFIEKVPDATPTTNTHYIPHHAVRKISSTTPIRIVYDCSCRQSPNHASLNDCLEAGPPLLNDMSAILLRFRTNHYDNILSGSDTELKSTQYFDEARSIMSEAKFNLRSWASNSPVLQSKASADGIADTTPPTNINVLGLRWDTSTDTIHFATKKSLPTSCELITKREILQQSSSIFDPLGMLAPVTIRAKILMQQLWQQSIDWDEPLNEQLHQDWLKLADDLHTAQQTVIPRRYHSSPTVSQDTPQFHVFADASKRAYGAVAYLLRNHEVALVMAKSRVAPIKVLTLPQLELMAALIGARLASFIHNAIKNRYEALEVHLWSDSQIVLHWLRSHKQLKQFVANRVKSIKDLFPSTIWHYCPTTDNPADLLTRGITTTQMHSSALWNNGPSWLTLFTEQWPTWTPTTALLIEAEQENEPTQPEISTPSISVDAGIHHVIDISRYSSLATLIHVTAYVLRFINNIIRRSPRRTGPLSVYENNTAENIWIQCCQRTTYSAELINLTTKNSSRLPLVKQLRLFLDQDHIIRCGGRIHNAPISQSAKFPILLPVNHPFTTLIIHSTHAAQLHSGVNSTLTALRDRFWIPRARQIIKKLLRKCVICRKQVGQPYAIPDPAPLPKWRVQDATPFSVTGVDFTGALFVKTPTNEEKVYICLFTCAATRAVHLEIVEDLSEETFLRAFRRFASRKSLPQKMVSDNASTYLAAAEELKHLFQSTSLRESLSRRGVDWHFIPKRAPWYGGFWERLIGLTKTVLKKVLGRTHVNLSSLQTILVEIEAVLNDRPLTYVSSDVEDEEPLTPAHLLYGRRITSLPHLHVEDDETNDPNFGNISEVTKRAQTLALILKHFWLRWKAEYLTSLREYHRTTGKNDQNVRVGEVVLIHDDTPRIKWKLAVVTDLIKGNDGHGRAASVCTSTGQTNRPIARLYPLEIRMDIAPKTERKEKDEEVEQRRHTRTAAKNALEKIAKWTNIINAPRRMSWILHKVLLL